jgi:hypothetical protein
MWYLRCEAPWDVGVNPGDPSRRDAVYVVLERTNVLRLALLTDGDPAAMIPRLHMEAAALPHRAQVQWAKTLEAQLAEPVAIFRAIGGALSALGAIALVLACQGLHALLAFSLSQRRREIAIRAALGASATDLVRSLAGRDARRILVGLLGGLALSAVLTRIVSLVPFDVQQGGLLFNMVVALALLSAAAAACMGPIHRALKLQPAEWLRDP